MPEELIETIVIAASIAIAVIWGIYSGIQDAANKRRLERALEISGQKQEKVSSPETATEVEIKIENPTVQRWFRESEYSYKEGYKEYLGQILEFLSKHTMEDIMSSNELKEWLFEELNSANKDKAA